ncbi:MAG TPA: 3'-5' exonuclease [Methanoregulaceae archaeon]|nr:3'-5' exonuclease [Methanoregulaceae archaeon]
MLLFIDTETTGLPGAGGSDIERWPRIVQLAWAVYDRDGNRDSVNSHIIYPADFIIPHDAAAIHGITTERAKAEGISLYKVLPELNRDIDRASAVIAHNADFDMPIVRTEFLRCRMATNLPEKYQFCTMKSKKIVECCRIPKQAGWGYKWPTLTELHSHLFETGFAGSHDAHADVEACARCFFELRKRGII